MLLLLLRDAKDVYRELGRSIRRHRTAAGVTQARLAAMAGISRASVANIEAGRQQVLVHHLYAIADALMLGSPAQLLPEASVSRVDQDDLPEIPVPEDGLTDQQRQQVLHLMSGVMGGQETEQAARRLNKASSDEQASPLPN